MQLFCVKSVKKDSENIVLNDIGLKGITKQGMAKGEASFQGIKFLTTSYYHEVRFIIVSSVGKSIPFATGLL